MSPRLIVNADDYGRSAGVSRGIRDAHLRGIVSSTTAMMNMPGVVGDLNLALEETPRLGLGVHLVLTAGRPLLPPDQIPSLVTGQGAFLPLDGLIEGREGLNPAEVQAEWRAQIEKFIQVTGRRPTHLDSHHHSSYFMPSWFRAMLELARDYDCAIRRPLALDAKPDEVGMPPELVALVQSHAPDLLAAFKPRCPDQFFVTFYDDRATQNEIERLITELPESGIYEIMCHPGYSDPALIAASSYARQRDVEVAILTSPQTLNAVRQRGIQLISFADL
jgi:hypothetical protein